MAMIARGQSLDTPPTTARLQTKAHFYYSDETLEGVNVTACDQRAARVPLSKNPLSRCQLSQGLAQTQFWPGPPKTPGPTESKIANCVPYPY